ncbi:MAG: hypothetical protein Q4F67_14215, partial [Propionibacteriaceae bacterium]|nr:hypothetical protein [Propionibacteriaceae bacterium]
MQLEELKPGVRVDGIIPGETVNIVAAQWHGTSAVELTYKTPGALGQKIVFRHDEASLSTSTKGSRPFNADATDFKLSAEAQRISLAGLYEPMLAVATT